jgi:hypothetical protein
MSFAIWLTLKDAGIYVTDPDFPYKGIRMMLTLWGILVSDWLAHFTGQLTSRHCLSNLRKNMLHPTVQAQVSCP